MRTERFRRILEAAGSADPKWFASEKQHIEKRERRFVGFVKPSNRRSFCVSREEFRATARKGERMTNSILRNLDRRRSSAFVQEPPEPVYCQQSERCAGCPYPRHGIVCWHPDGTCLRTDMNKINGLKEKNVSSSSAVRCWLTMISSQRARIRFSAIPIPAIACSSLMQRVRMAFSLIRRDITTPATAHSFPMPTVC